MYIDILICACTYTTHTHTHNTPKTRNIVTGMEKQASYEMFFICQLQPELFIWVTENMLYLNQVNNIIIIFLIVSHLRGEAEEEHTASNNTISQFDF